jgi:hypothetical protein
VILATFIHDSQYAADSTSGAGTTHSYLTLTTGLLAAFWLLRRARKKRGR